MDNFLYQSTDLDVTPESLAWKLLMDDDIEDFAGILLPPFVINDDSLDLNIIPNSDPLADDCPTSDSETDSESQLKTKSKLETKSEPKSENLTQTLTDIQHQQLAELFEILITLYMELVFGLLKIYHINANLDENGDIPNNIDLDKTFNPDLSKFKVNDLIGLFREKLKKIRIFLSVHEISDTDMSNTKDFGYYAEYYCKILFKNTPEGKTHYWLNRNRHDPTKYYMFAIRNDQNKKQKKLNDFYAVCALPNIKVKISFSPINIIVNDPHMTNC